MSIITRSTLTMSSREIAELVEARHNDVVATIERLFDKGLLRSSRKSRREATGGRPLDVYDLTERDTHLVVAGYSDEHRARVIDRWQDLEKKQFAPAVPQSLPEALRLAAEAIEERDRLALDNKRKDEALAEVTPKAQALDRIASPTEGAVGLRIAAKLLQMPERQFLQFAHSEGWIFRNAHSRVWQGYAEKAKAGLVEQKFTTVTRDDGSEKTVEQVLITRLGLAKLAEKLERRGVCNRMMTLTVSTVGQSRPSITPL